MHKIDIWLEIETKCNLNCMFCYNYWKNGNMEAPTRISTTELIVGLNNLFKVIECEQITISGGEPFLREDIYEILSFLKSKEIPVIVTTNGSLLDVDKFALLKEFSINTFQIPLHSMDEKVHNFLCGKNCHYETIDAMLCLIQNEFNVVPVFVATKLNIEHFNSILKACKQMQITDVIFNRFIPSGLGEYNEHLLGVPSDNDISIVLNKCYEFAKLNSIVIHLGVPVLPEYFTLKQDYIRSSSCLKMGQHSRWTIDSNCNIKTCSHSNKFYGNLLTGGEKAIVNCLDNSVDNYNQYRPCKIIEEFNNTKLFNIKSNQ